MTGGQFISWGSKIKTFLTQSYLWPWSGVIGDRSHLKYSLYCQMHSFGLVLNHFRLISYQFYPLLRPLGVSLSPEGQKLKQSQPKNGPSHDLVPKIAYLASSVYNKSFIALKEVGNFCLAFPQIGFIWWRSDRGMHIIHQNAQNCEAVHHVWSDFWKSALLYFCFS